MVLLTAFSVVLRHFGAGDDVVVGSDVSNRESAESEGLIGFFVNQIVLRTDLSGDPDLGQAVERARQVAEGAFAHQEMPFARLVRELAPTRRGDMPLFRAKMVLQNQPLEEVAAEGLEMRPADVFPGVAKFDLLLNLAETADGLGCWLEYRRDLFTEEAAVDLLAALRFVLERLATAPETSLSRLDAAVAGHVAEARRRRQEARDRSLDTLRTASLGRVRRKAVRS
jgi:non-ribosomal peptide synthetase component F